MNYGLYLAASGMQTSMYRMDVYANNLANMNTAGFRPDVPATRQRDCARVEDDLGNYPGNTLLDKLGGGVLMAPTLVSNAQGMLEVTGNALDVALKGDGFFVVSTGSGTDSLKFSRDGRMVMNKNGTLVQASSGHPVLDTSDSAITLDRNLPVQISLDGGIRQGGKLVANLQVATVANPSTLRKRGDNLLDASAEAFANRKPGNADVQQGTIERSSVDAIKATLDVSSAERAVSRSAKMVQIYDEVMQRTISTFGRVA